MRAQPLKGFATLAAVLMLAPVALALGGLPGAGDAEGAGWTSVAFTWRAGEPLSITLTAFDLPNWTAPWQMGAVLYNEHGYRASFDSGAYRTSDGHWIGGGGVGIRFNGDEDRAVMSKRSDGDWPHRLDVTATWDVTPRHADERLQAMLWVAGPVSGRAWQINGASSETVVNLTRGSDVFLHDTPDFGTRTTPQIEFVDEATDAVRGPDERERFLELDAPREMFFDFSGRGSDEWCYAAQAIPESCTWLVPVRGNGPLPSRDGASVTDQDGRTHSAWDGRVPAGTYTFSDRYSRLVPYQCTGLGACTGQQYGLFDHARVGGAFGALATFE